MRLITALLLTAMTINPTAEDHWWLADYQQLELDGSGVRVAVIDTGVDDSHPDLDGVVIDGADFSGIGTPDGTSPVGPGGFHGTMVASLIAGQGETSGGVIGIAPGVELLAISIGLGVPGADTDAQVADAIHWAVDNGASVINLSISRNSELWPKSWDEAFLYAFGHDVVVVAASGNRTQGEQYATAPATIPGVIGVTAIDSAGDVGTSAGAAGINVAIAAPGVQMLGSYPGGDVRVWEGSSAAAPIVTGLVALMRQADPVASANDIIARLLESAVDAGQPGVDADYGYGIVNPAQAIESSTISPTNPLGSLAKWVELYRPSASEESADLLLPSEPGSETKQDSPGQAVQEAPAGPNPLLYWLLVPLAPLLWLALRGRFGSAKQEKSESNR